MKKKNCFTTITVGRKTAKISDEIQTYHACLRDLNEARIRKQMAQFLKSLVKMKLKIKQPVI
jgi:hypothetical protein